MCAALFRRCVPGLPILILAIASHAASYQYFRIGNKEDVQTKTSWGVAMLGGGSDLDQAFLWLCDKANGGDFLILRAHGTDDYNSYVQGLCKVNSVATLIIPDRQAALDPAVPEIIRHAEAVFISGGDQSLYVKDWQNTPVQLAINANIEQGKPIGGTSAGLAVEGEFAYAALNDPDDKELHSDEALTNPYHPEVTVVRDFLKITVLRNTLTDSHFAIRDRMGRTLVFLARIIQNGWSNAPREIAVDEKSAVLVETDGKATVVGSGKGAYFLRPNGPPETCQSNVPLTFRNISVYRVASRGHFDLATWRSDAGVPYSVSVEKGIVRSTQAGGAVY